MKKKSETMNEMKFLNVQNAHSKKKQTHDIENVAFVFYNLSYNYNVNNIY